MLLAVMAALSMVLGNCVAITQRNVKRLLAYSRSRTLAISSSASSRHKDGGDLGVFYVIVYGLTEPRRIRVVAALSSPYGGDDMEDFSTGMARQRAASFAVELIFVLSLAGIPPLGGSCHVLRVLPRRVQHDPQEFGLLWRVVLGIFMSAVSLY